MSGARPGSHDSGSDVHELGTASLLAFGVLTGVLGTIGSFAFLYVIVVVQNLLFRGQLSLAFDPHAPLPAAPWGMGVVLVPVIGGLGVVWITRRISGEVRGSGVPEVLYALYYHGGRIRPRVAFAKGLASALSIGSGASVGREGPIVQISGALAAAAAFAVHMPAHQRVVLVAAGAAAGIAATFGAPLGGLAFAVELLLLSVSARNVAVVAVATAVAAYLAGTLAGFGRLFPVPALEPPDDPMHMAVQLAAALPFGVVVGLAAAGLEHAVAALEDTSKRLVANDYLRHALAMTIVGGMLYAFVMRTGQYHVAGVGYATIEGIVEGLLADPGFLLLLFVAKLAATTLALGTGASGGVFAPGLFLGAALGAAYAGAAQWLGLAEGFEAAVWAIAGMAAFVGAATAAVVTAGVMVLEITGGYGAILPLVFATGLAYLVRLAITTESMYTLKLARRGRAVPQGLQAAVSSPLDASQVMSRDVQVVQLRGHLRDPEVRYTLAADGDALVGFLDADRPEPDTAFGIVAPDARWPVIMRALKTHGTERLVVADGESAGDVQGVITFREIARAERDKAELME